MGESQVQLTRPSRMVPRKDILPRKFTRQELLDSPENLSLEQNFQRDLQAVSINVGMQKSSTVTWKDIITVFEDCSIFVACQEIEQFEVVNFDGTKLDIQFNFFSSDTNSTLFIQKQDSVEVEQTIRLKVFIDGRFLYDAEAQSFLDKLIEFVIEMPRQCEPNEGKLYSEQVEVVESAAATIFSGNFIVALLLGASLKYLWNVINLI